MNPLARRRHPEELPDWGQDLEEAAYRRGFAQAAYLAVEAVREGQPLSELVEWHEDCVEWRYSQRGGKLRKVGPPEPWTYAKKKGGK